jgi:hypothetical protein
MSCYVGWCLIYVCSFSLREDQLVFLAHIYIILIEELRIFLSQYKIAHYITFRKGVVLFCYVISDLSFTVWCYINRIAEIDFLNKQRISEWDVNKNFMKLKLSLTWPGQALGVPGDWGCPDFEKIGIWRCARLLSLRPSRLYHDRKYSWYLFL